MPLPGEPLYPTVLPFISTSSGLSVVGGGLTTEIQTWESGPSRLDLTFYEGDDITVPLTFEDPNDPTLDMSEASEWDWFSQIRTGHGPLYPLVADFICDADYVAPAPPDQPLGVTNVKMVLPRQDNIYIGTFSWDLVSVSPVPGHPDEEPQPDETPGTGHTWLWGEVTVLPRVTHPDGQWPPGVDEEEVAVPTFNSFLAVTTGTGFTVGPNGRIP